MTSTEIASANKIMLGTTEATAMYIGSTQIWTAPPIVPYDAEIEYLESTGTQYINTGIIANPGEISFEVDCTIENNSGSGVYTTGGLHYIYQSSNGGIRTGGTNNVISYTLGNRVTITASYNNYNRRIITIGNNVVTVPSLYKFRKWADYNRSLDVLSYAKQKGFITKTGIMLGLGETEPQLLELFKDLKRIDCDILTIGQYLKPLKDNAEMVKEYTDEEFEYLKQKALEAGIKTCVSGKYVRSSYFAESTYKIAFGNFEGQRDRSIEVWSNF